MGGESLRGTIRLSDGRRLVGSGILCLNLCGILVQCLKPLRVDLRSRLAWINSHATTRDE
jgi:hypothetical protein